MSCVERGIDPRSLPVILHRSDRCRYVLRVAGDQIYTKQQEKHEERRTHRGGRVVKTNNRRERKVTEENLS